MISETNLFEDDAFSPAARDTPFSEATQTADPEGDREESGDQPDEDGSDDEDEGEGEDEQEDSSSS